MKLATLKNGSRDGALILVSRDLRQYQRVAAIAPTLQAALDAGHVPGYTMAASHRAFALRKRADIAHTSPPTT